MAKRKRLTPARLDAATPPAAPEVKSALPTGIRPPIADVAHDAVTTNALTELSEKISTARTEGRWIEPLNLDAIVADHLVRDRVDVDAEEMETLRSSLRENGQQTAIEVMALPDGRYGLISGWRRVSALRDLALTEGIDTVLAIVRRPDDVADAYLSMVEENEIRVGLSFYERGRIVVRAVDGGVYDTDKAALKALFHAVPRAKRSKIGSFVRLVRGLDDILQFPTAMSERSGLALVQALGSDVLLPSHLRHALVKAAPKDGAEEQAAIARFLTARASTAPATTSPPAPMPKPVELQPGLALREQANGKLLLEGDLLKNTDFVARLSDMLRTLK